MYGILLFIIVIVIISIISMTRDGSSKSKLKKNLNNMGYACDATIDIPDINNDIKPFCFIVDRTKRKWFLANYRSDMATPYSFDDILDYKITYRTKGTSVSYGKEFSGYYSEFSSTNQKISTMMELNKSNCEHISFELMYTGKAHDEQICNKFVLFEDQNGNFSNAQNHDFVVPSLCIETAKEFEDLLFEILTSNKTTTENNYGK